MTVTVEAEDMDGGVRTVEIMSSIPGHVWLLLLGPKEGVRERIRMDARALIAGVKEVIAESGGRI